MKTKRILLFLLISALSVTLMGCPSIRNMAPQFAILVDGEPESVVEVTYEYVKGTQFDPNDMIQFLIENENLRAIDYNQEKVIWGVEREFEDISDDIIITNFYQRWEEDSDANFDGVVDELDEELWGSLKTDQEGNYILDEGIGGTIFVLEVLTSIGGEMKVTLRVTDSEGLEAELPGVIKVVAQEE